MKESRKRDLSKEMRMELDKAEDAARRTAYNVKQKAENVKFDAEQKARQMKRKMQ